MKVTKSIARVCTVLTPTRVPEGVQNQQTVNKYENTSPYILKRLMNKSTIQNSFTFPSLSPVHFHVLQRNIEGIRGHVHPPLQAQVLYQATRGSKGCVNPVHLIQGGDVCHEELQGVLQGHKGVWLLISGERRIEGVGFCV